MMDAKVCLEDIKANIVLSSVVKSITIVAERTLNNRGYFRARMRLVNDDFLEVSEYIVAGSDGCSTKEYRYQWMDHAQQQLIKRWDNAKHFPNLENFPHHIHVRKETDVIPGMAISIIELLDLLEREIQTGLKKD
jgi:hypothetical protein